LDGLKNPRLNEALLTFQCETDTLLQITEKDIDILMSGEYQKFIEGLQIITKNEGKKSLIYNPAQEKLWEWYLGKRESHCRRPWNLHQVQA